MQGPDAVTSLQ